MASEQAEGTVRATSRHVANYWTVVEARRGRRCLHYHFAAVVVGLNGQPRCPQQNKRTDLEAVAVLESFVSRHLYPDSVPTPKKVKTEVPISFDTPV